MNRMIARILVAVAGLSSVCLLLSSPAFAATGWLDGAGNPTTQEHASYWADSSGNVARSKEFFDPVTGAWYWADPNGVIARDKDVWQPSNGGKWVRYDANGRMIKGEDYRYGSWYLFDEATGAMEKGVVWVASNGGKWVYYDSVTGKMAHGEAYLDYDVEHTGWYFFDETTGAMYHGDRYVPSDGGKWVRYDNATGKMVKGLDFRNNAWYRFDELTGAMQKGRTWVPEWSGWYNFDSVTGRLIGAAGNGSESNGGDTPDASVVYWTPKGKRYHSTKSCPSLSQSKTIIAGSIADAQASGRTACKDCW